MPRYAVDLEYAGGAFSGTQAQSPDLRTLQGVMEGVLADLAGGPTGFRACSRLDQGVGALSLPGDFTIGRAWDPPVLGRALNARLPDDVVARRVAAVDDGWSARRAALKTYRYQVLHRPVRPVLARDALWVRELTHPELLPLMAALLPGDRDLSGFSSLRGDDSDALDPRRLYTAAQWSRANVPCGELWTFRISGWGFLYRQVRSLVGAMVHIAQGRRPLELFQRIIDSGRGAERCGNVAPACGLLLERVAYDPDPQWRTVAG